MPAKSQPTIPSLADDQAEFHKLNDELFGDGTGVHVVGKGKVYAGRTLNRCFQRLESCRRTSTILIAGKRQQILFVHRKLADGDMYFVDNRSDQDSSVDASFRVTGKAPELWHSDTGKIEPASYQIADGRTTVPLHFEPWGTVFVVFRKRGKADVRKHCPSRRRRN